MHPAIKLIIIAVIPMSIFAGPEPTQIRSLLTEDRPSLAKYRLEIRDAGSFNTGAGKLTIVDPGFMHPALLSHLLREAPQMEAKVKLAVIKSGENIGMPALLVLLFNDPKEIASVKLVKQNRSPNGEKPGYVGVDSGEICVIQTDKIPGTDEKILYEFGDTLIKNRNPKELIKTVPKQGAIVCKSGNGDGAYPCYWLENEAGGLVALLIDFENWHLAN